MFNKRYDRREVDQFGFIDLRQAYDKGVLSGEVSLNDLDFNGVQNPSGLLPHPQDDFEAMRQAEYVREGLKSAKNKTVKETAAKQVEGAQGETSPDAS